VRSETSKGAVMMKNKGWILAGLLTVLLTLTGGLA
jgi:hypothetical protein